MKLLVCIFRFTKKYASSCLKDPVTLLPPSMPTELYTSLVYNSLVCLLCAVKAGFGNFHVEFMSRVICSFTPPSPYPLSILSWLLTCTQTSNLMTLQLKPRKEKERRRSSLSRSRRKSQSWMSWRYWTAACVGCTWSSGWLCNLNKVPHS